MAMAVIWHQRAAHYFTKEGTTDIPKAPSSPKTRGESGGDQNFISITQINLGTMYVMIRHLLQQNKTNKETRACTHTGLG